MFNLDSDEKFTVSGLSARTDIRLRSPHATARVDGERHHVVVRQPSLERVEV